MSFAIYLAVPIAGLAVILMYRAGTYFAMSSLWPVGVTLVVAAPANALAAWWLGHAPNDPLRLHVRAIVTAVSTAGVIYFVGWGPMLIVAYALGAAELLRTTGAGTAAPHMLWCVLAVAAGEVGVELGWLPSVLHPGLSHALALTGLACLAIVARVLANAADATDAAKDALRERGAYFEALIRHANDMIGVVRRDGFIESMSPSVRTILGYTPEEVAGRNIVEFLQPEVVPTIAALVEAAAPGAEAFAQLELELRHRDGNRRLVAATLSAPAADRGDHIIVNLHDITHQRALEQQLRHDATHDALTGLMNRKAFGEACEGAYARAMRHGWSVGMLYIDLDGFKTINDSFGHDLGDIVLVETSRRLADCIRREDVLARLGGDEFAVLLEAVDGPDDAITLAERILLAVAEPIPRVPDSTPLGASIGIAIRGSDGIEITNLMRLADEAMYCAKRNGRSRWEIDADLREHVTAG